MVLFEAEGVKAALSTGAVQAASAVCASIAAALNVTLRQSVAAVQSVKGRGVRPFSFKVIA
jgi:hypothetical protein